jgi:ABC-type glycerol-3-phosphate transport system permease component
MKAVVTAVPINDDRTMARPRSISKRRTRRSSVLSRVFCYIVLLAAAGFFVLPLGWMLLSAVKTQPEVLAIPIRWLPSRWHWSNFGHALFDERFAGETFARFLLNSTIVATATALACVLLSIMVGYGFAKFRFRGRDALLWVVLGSTLLPFSSVVIPLFIIVQRLGQLDSLVGLTLPFLLTGASIFISRQFIRGIPDDYIEAARIDGASETWVFLHIVLPLSRSAISTVAVIAFLASWNQFLWPLVISSSQSNFTAPLGLSLLGVGSSFQTDYQIWMASATLAMIPPLVFFLILERPYLRGLEMMSGVK